MLWLEEWKAWSGRLAALTDILRLYVAHDARERGLEEITLPIWAGGWLGRSIALRKLISSCLQMNSIHEVANSDVIPQLKELFPLLQEFNDRFAQQLPEDVAKALAKFLSTKKGARDFQESGGFKGLPGALRLAGLLATVRSQVDYFLADKQARAWRASERAFTHLQRSIVVDKDVRKRWKEAFKSGEEACEKLGAVHMLLHGIWAFKAEAKGGKTDLILGDKVNEDDAGRAADALVLTEWKMVKGDKTPEDQMLAAYHQAERYRSETLAGFELSSHRFLVLVSEDFINLVPTPPGRLYEVRNIAVNPASPSRMAVAAARGNRRTAGRRP